MSRLPARVVILYSLPAFGLSAMSLVFYTYLLKFYSDSIGVTLTYLGAVILGVRIWDALLDPVIGSLSDRTSSPLGRRRPWMLMAALPMGACFWALLTPASNDQLATIALPVWAGLFFLFWTCVTIPYEAMGAELSPNYDERNRLLGAREGAGIAGMIVGAISPGVLEALFQPSDPRQLHAWLGALLGTAAAASVLVSATLIQEEPVTNERRPRELMTPDWRVLIRNRPFRLLVIAFTLVQIGIGVSTTLYSYFNDHVIGHTRGEWYLGLYLLVGLLSIPPWIWVARRLEKRMAWQIAMLLCTISFAFVLLLGTGESLLYLALILISALGLGGMLAIPPSMQADTIDLDESQTGRRREGQFLGIWCITRKAAQAVGAAATLPLLHASGYIAGSSDQPPFAIWTMSLLYAGVPCFCYALAVLAIHRYGLDRDQHTRIRASLEVTHRREVISSPVPPTLLATAK